MKILIEEYGDRYIFASDKDSDEAPGKIIRGIANTLDSAFHSVRRYFGDDVPIIFVFDF